jgi:hypothetical protein
MLKWGPRERWKEKSSREMGSAVALRAMAEALATADLRRAIADTLGGGYSIVSD